MRVFITWSGKRSQAVAEAIRTWLPGVLQAVKPYFSPDDVTKGSRWYPEIAKELDESNVGLLCMTRDNLNAPWLLFEAGALGKNLDKSKVCPLLFDLEPTDITGPLSQFQGARFNKTEFKKVVEMINGEIIDGALESGVLDDVFDMWWPKLEVEITEALKVSDDSESRETRSDRDILEEILALNRSISRTEHIQPSHFADHKLIILLVEYHRLLNFAAAISLHPVMARLLTDLEKSIRYVCRSLGNESETLKEIERLVILLKHQASTAYVKSDEVNKPNGDHGNN